MEEALLSCQWGMELLVSVPGCDAFVPAALRQAVIRSYFSAYLSEYLPSWAGPNGSKGVKACSWRHSAWRKTVWEARRWVNLYSWEARSQRIHNHATSSIPEARRKNGAVGMAGSYWRRDEGSENRLRMPGLLLHGGSSRHAGMAA